MCFQNVCFVNTFFDFICVMFCFFFEFVEMFVFVVKLNFFALQFHEIIIKYVITNTICHQWNVRFFYQINDAQHLNRQIHIVQNITFGLHSLKLFVWFMKYLINIRSDVKLQHVDQNFDFLMIQFEFQIICEFFHCWQRMKKFVYINNFKIFF